MIETFLLSMAAYIGLFDFPISPSYDLIPEAFGTHESRLLKCVHPGPDLHLRHSALRLMI